MSQAIGESPTGKQYWTLETSIIYHLDRDCQTLKSARTDIEEADGPLEYNERECIYCCDRPQEMTDRLKRMDPSDFP